MTNIYTVFLLFSFFAGAQNIDIQVTPDGFSPVVVSVDSLPASKIYDKAKSAVNHMFDEPRFALKVDDPGKMLRFTGSRKFKGGISSEGYYRYTCELEFKDGRYKISFYDVFLDKASHTTYKDLYDKSGILRKLDFYKKVHDNFSSLVNAVHSDLKKSILSDPAGW